MSKSKKTPASSSRYPVIDGTGKSGKAPRPRVKSLLRAIYDVINAWNGVTTQQVKEFLPAAIENYKQVLSDKRIELALYNGVYRGYFIFNQRNDHYYIAPLDYYDARQEYVKDLEAHAKRNGKGTKRKRIEAPVQKPIVYQRPLWHWSMIAGVASMAFAVGILVGIVICKL